MTEEPEDVISNEWDELEKEIDSILKDIGEAKPEEPAENAEPAPEKTEETRKLPEDFPKDFEPPANLPNIDLETMAHAVEAHKARKDSIIQNITQKLEASVPSEYRTPAFREAVRNHLKEVSLNVLAMTENDEGALSVVRKVAIGEVVTSRKERVPPPPSGEPVGGNVTWGAHDLSGDAGDIIAAAQKIFGLTPEEIEKALNSPGGEL